MRSLFLYYLKKRLPVMGIISFLVLISTIIFVSNVLRATSDTVNTSFTSYFAVVLTISVTAVPVFEFHFKMRKNSVDLFYSLPIKRIKLFLVKYLIGLIEITAIFTVCYIYVLIAISAFTISKQISFNYGLFLLYYPIILVVATLTYSFISFFYSQGNTVFDGWILVGLSTSAFTVLALAITRIGVNFAGSGFYGNTDILGLISMSPYTPLFDISGYFEKALKGVTVDSINYGGIAVISVLCLLALFFFFKLNAKKKAEDVGDIQKEWYLYKFFIPYYIVLLFVIVGKTPYAWIYISILGYIGYVINNRHFKITNIDWICLASSIFVGIALDLLVFIN